ncbi:MAG: hypothetical protein M3R36_16925 [Bacteroidota bacterium]|nr:hypothetical protein [Bacteroidota bacterium]
MFKIFILIILITSEAVYAEPITIPDLFSTGVDDQYNVLPDGTTDFHYRILSSADISFPGPDAKVVLSTGFPMDAYHWCFNNERSKWIAPRVDAGKFNEVGTYVYRIQFDLSKFKAGTAIIAGLWSTDNNGLDILINNKSTGYFTPIEAYHGMFPFEIRSGFADGINTIDFVVYNINAPTGLRVEITGKADPKEYVLN